MKTINANGNPWMGLETYKEGQIIFGRNEEIKTVAQSVIYNLQTVIYGKSGIGKSSLLNAGVFPLLRRANLFPVEIRLAHNSEKSYNDQIKEALFWSLKNLRTEAIDSDGNTYIRKTEGTYKELCPAHSEDEGMWEFLHRHQFYLDADGLTEIKPVLLFDQFEEIFTLERNMTKVEDFFDELADLLNNIAPDYLCQSTPIMPVAVPDERISTNGMLELVDDGLEEIAAANYLMESNFHVVITLREDYLSYLERNIDSIPLLKQNRYCLRPLSEDQAATIMMDPCPGLIDVDVAKEIIHQITQQDVNSFEIDDKPELEIDAAILSLFLREMYDRKAADAATITVQMVQTLGSNIITEFYNNTTGNSDEVKPESIAYLEDTLVTDKGCRDNIYVSRVEKHVSRKELDYLIEKRLIREFPWNNEMRIEFMHDILCPVIVQNRQVRHERQAKAEQERLQQEASRQLLSQRRHRIARSAMLLIVVALIFSYLGFYYPVSRRYAQMTKRYGWFVGVEPISKKQAKYLGYHFVFHKKGILTKHFNIVECRDGYDSLSYNHSIHPYITTGQADEYLDEDMNEQLSNICQWEIIVDMKEDRVIQERAYDKRRELVYAFNRNLPSKLRDGNAIIGSYSDEQGISLNILKSGYVFVRISYDQRGYESLVEYFDINGYPTNNQDGAYQTRYVYNNQGLLISIASLNKYGKRMIDRAGNCGQTFTYDGYKQISVLSTDEFGREFPVTAGYSEGRYKYDEYGREVELSLWCKGKPVVGEGLSFHRRVVSYNDRGNVTDIVHYDTQDSILYEQFVEYDVHGRATYYLQSYPVTDKIETGCREYGDDLELISLSDITIQDGDTVGRYIFKKRDSVEIRRFEGDIYNDEYINKTTYDSRKRVVEDVYYRLDSTLHDGFYQELHCYNDDGDGIFKQEIDSAIYITYNPNEDTLLVARIEVLEKQPTQKSQIRRTYATPESEADILYQNFDDYGNIFEEYYGNARAVYLINPRTHTRHEKNDAIGFLTRYKFPYDGYAGRPFGYIRYDDNGELKWMRCDENADTLNISNDYKLPTIYTEEREYPVIFVEWNELGVKEHGVILETDNGICYGLEDYKVSNINSWDDVVYLNLTTMQYEEAHLLTDSKYWTIYTGIVGKQEYEIYQDHYNRYKLMHNK